MLPAPGLQILRSQRRSRAEGRRESRWHDNRLLESATFAHPEDAMAPDKTASRLVRLEERVETLKAEMNRRFDQVPTRDEMNTRLVQFRDEMNARFDQVPTRDEMNARFAQVPTRDEMNARFDQVPTRDEVLRIAEETRRHFDIVYERSRDDVKMLAAAHRTLAGAQDGLAEDHAKLVRSHEKLTDRVARIERRIFGH